MTVKISESEIVRRRTRITAAAAGVFLRYGFGKTTMGDIASAAKVSRPALYLLFPRKEDVFAAVVEQLSAEKLAELRRRISKLSTLDRKLHLCCESWGAHGVDLIEQHPDARDLFDLSVPAVQNMYQEFIAFLAGLLAPAMATAKLKSTPQILAHNLVYSMLGFKAAARDGRHMREMIVQQVDLLLAALKANGC